MVSEAELLLTLRGLVRHNLSLQTLFSDLVDGRRDVLLLAQPLDLSGESLLLFHALQTGGEFELLFGQLRTSCDVVLQEAMQLESCLVHSLHHLFDVSSKTLLLLILLYLG